MSEQTFDPTNPRKHRDYHERNSTWPEETHDCSACEDEFEAELSAKHKADAALIEKQREEIKRLRDAARQVIDELGGFQNALQCEGLSKLRAALADEPKEAVEEK